MDIPLIIESFEHALMIVIFVFAMMVLVDYLNVFSKGKMNKVIKGSKGRQYTIASLLGATPGCLGAFTNVSFYVHGLISFGAIAGGMLATSGDEAFVMLALFPKQALLLFLLLFVMGIVFAWMVDKLVPILNIKTAENCKSVTHNKIDEDCKCFDAKAIVHMTYERAFMLLILLASIISIAAGRIGAEEEGWIKITFLILLSVTIFIFATVPEHYLKDHIWKHIVKKHLLKVFLWSFFAILLIRLGLHYWDIELFIKIHMVWVLVIASLLALIPESGPHLIFVMMFAQGLIPFSVLFVSAVVQDGHGMLPLLSYSVKDTITIKLLKLVFGLLIGFGIYLLGF